MTLDDAMRRWLSGHHVFFVLIQGIVINHRRLLNALQQQDIASARQAFLRAARLLDGSAGAMLLAGDMPRDCYESIRLSMTPPAVPDGFSGVWSADHRAMMDDLKALKSHIDTLNPVLEPERQAWKAAMDRAYQAHAHVCEHFVGDGPSLAMRSDSRSCQRSALDNLDAFRQRALALVSGRTVNVGPDTATEELEQC